MAETAELSEPSIERWVGEASFGRGWGYYRDGHILNPRRQGDTLKARCLGSQPSPYYVEVTLGKGGILSSVCSCPVGGGGHCKHVAALLLTWVHRPEAFAEVEELEAALGRRSQAELIALIRRMIQRYPDLEALLELPVVGEEGDLRPVDREVIRRQARRAFQVLDYGWETALGIAGELAELVDIGHDYAERGGWHDAATVYEVVAREILEQYGMVQDEGELIGVVNECVEGLGRCLGAAENPDWRAALLRALFDVYRWDVDYGGIDAGYQVPDIILEQATAEEKERVTAWVREALPLGQSWSDGYHRQVYGGFLLALQEDQLDDEATLRICRETGRWHDLVDRLLALGRLEEAIAAARGVGDYDLLRLADLFVSHGQAGVAERLIGERAEGSRDTRLLAWLKERAELRGDLGEALSLAETLFWRSPSLQEYRQVRDLGQSTGRWGELRTATLAHLAEQGHYNLLTEIHLEEGEVDRALETLGRVQASPWGWGGGDLAIRVAEAAEEERPREAMRIYQERVERLIAARGRGNYVTAVAYLSRLRELYRRLGELATWEATISDLRENNRRLRALREELDKVGL